MSISPAERLPTEILRKIFYHVEASDLLHCRCVCETWKRAASDALLWQVKLSDLLTRQGTVITCEKRPANAPDFNDLATVNSYKMYKFVSQYVLPFNRPSSMQSSEPTGNIISTKPTIPSHDCQSRISRVMSTGMLGPMNIWIAGAGIDARGESCIIDDLYNSNLSGVSQVFYMFIHNRYGVTIRFKDLTVLWDDSLLSDAIKKNRDSYVHAVNVRQLFQHTKTGGSFPDQSERILQSPLFHVQRAHLPMTVEEQLSGMVLESSYGTELMSVDGLIYTVDARIPASQMTFLYHELGALIRGFPDNVRSRVPVLILYVMQAAKVSIHPGALQSLDHWSTADKSPDDSRKRYGDAHEERSWRGSLLLPLSCLRLFELENPWRLQRCISNDYKTVLECIRWLLERNATVDQVKSLE